MLGYLTAIGGGGGGDGVEEIGVSWWFGRGAEVVVEDLRLLEQQQAVVLQVQGFLVVEDILEVKLFRKWWRRFTQQGQDGAAAPCGKGGDGAYFGIGGTLVAYGGGGGGGTNGSVEIRVQLLEWVVQVAVEQVVKMFRTVAQHNRGGGGGGAGGDSSNAGSTGGSGVIVIRYGKIKAPLTNLVASGTTGGSVTFEGDEAVHTFTSPGTFTSGADMNVDVLIVVGGGGGGADRGVEEAAMV